MVNDINLIGMTMEKKQGTSIETILAQVNVSTSTAALLSVADYPLKYSSVRNKSILNSIRAVSTAKGFK